jgi:Domain of unknown function (DUF4157)
MKKRQLRKMQPVQVRSKETKDNPLFFPAVFSGNHSGQFIQRSCATCGDDKEKLQRKENGHALMAPGHVSNYIQHLNGSGDQLPRETKQFFESRMQQDFSQVKIHTGAEAGASARAINAKAYTYKNNIVFGEGQYAPHAAEGKKLLAHELTHVVQQGGDSIKRQTVSSALPTVTQGQLDICGAASLITALMIWDNENPSPGAPNSRFVAAVNIVLSYFNQHHNSIVAGMQTRMNMTPAVAQTTYTTITSGLTHVLALARTPGHVVNDTEYQLLGTAIYALYVNRTAGLSAAAISNIETLLGVGTGTTNSGIIDFSLLISDPILRVLQPGQIAQLHWYVRPTNTTIGLHAFLVGRLNNGTWYLHDQGPSTAMRLQAGSLSMLESLIRIEVNTNGYWLDTRSHTTPPIMGWTGVRLLGANNAVVNTSRGLIPSGTLLAEVDEGAFTNGSLIHSGAFVSEHYVVADALTAAAGISGAGAVVIEMPQGRFVVYRTNQVSDANRWQTAIDISGGGLFTGTHTFFKAWLQLRSPAGLGSLIRVY